MRLLKALSALGTFAGLVAGKVSIESITGTSAVITWDGNSKAEINLNRLDARSRGVIDVGQNGQYELADLTPGAQYSVRVTEEGREPETLEFNTKPPKLTGSFLILKVGIESKGLEKFIIGCRLYNSVFE